MAKILVAHPNLWDLAGAGAVPLHIVEALQNEHDVSVLTMRDRDVDELNEFYSTNISHLPIHTDRPAGFLLYHNRFMSLQKCLFARSLKKINPPPDLVISTFWDLPIPYDSITYVHHPSQVIHHSPRTYSRSRFQAWYFRMCGSMLPSEKGKSYYVANSNWTADQASKYLDRRPQVIYPLVPTSDIDPKPWETRENRIITVGRIAPDKNILRNIQIVSRLQERGHRIEYHIVGPMSAWDQVYIDKVKREVERYDFIHLEGKISRAKLINMLSTYKYGLHGHDCEHFGIAIAEIVAGGAIPFITNDGGQQEIVNYCEDVIYNSVQDAIDKMDYILSSEETQKEVLQKLPNISDEFGPKRFRNEINQLVERVLMAQHHYEYA